MREWTTEKRSRFAAEYRRRLLRSSDRFRERGAVDEIVHSVSVLAMNRDTMPVLAKIALEALEAMDGGEALANDAAQAL